jgi:drug/metabolite transporter (DMT)-like permease
MDATTASAAKDKTALDIASIATCALVWGTTFYAITLQLGVVDPLVSVVYRFALSAVLLFAWCRISGERIALTRNQHLAAAAMGILTFAGNYPLVYVAQQYVNSGVVAILYAAMAFINLMLFRILLGQRTRAIAWIGALLGIAGVALISWDEFAASRMSEHASFGLGLAMLAVVMASLGNVAARKGEDFKAPVPSLTAWSMAYGALALAIFTQLSGRAWTFEATPEYIGSLLYLSIAGSVIAFVLYFGLARRRGYGTAAYVSAMAPLVAMFVSGVLEHKSWGVWAFVAVALVLGGQVLLLRAKKA